MEPQALDLARALRLGKEDLMSKAVGENGQKIDMNKVAVGTEINRPPADDISPKGAEKSTGGRAS